jgi:glycosyltransferase 2 family protein
VAVEPLKAGWMKAVVASTVVAAAAYLAVVLWVGHVQVRAALQMVTPQIVVALLTLSMVNYGLRFLRWHAYLRALGGSIPVLHDLRIYVGGFALTTTPGKAGEIARTLWLHPYGIPAVVSVAAFLSERILDFLVILLLSGSAAALTQGARWPLFIAVTAVGCVLLVIYLPTFVVAPLRRILPHSVRMQTALARFLEIVARTRACLTPARSAWGLLIGILAWSAEGVGLFLLLYSFGQSLSPMTAVSVYALSMLAGAVSFLPGGLGGSEATMVLLLTVLKVPLPVAVAGTLIVRLTTLWFAVALGGGALLINLAAPKPAVQPSVSRSPAPLA